MALGVIRVRKNLCKYSSRAPNKRLRGKFTRCAGKKLTGKSAPRKRRGGKRRGKAGCHKAVVSQYGNMRCMKICRNKKGVETFREAASGCGVRRRRRRRK